MLFYLLAPAYHNNPLVRINEMTEYTKRCWEQAVVCNEREREDLFYRMAVPRIIGERFVYQQDDFLSLIINAPLTYVQDIFLHFQLIKIKPESYRLDPLAEICWQIQGYFASALGHNYFKENSHNHRLSGYDWHKKHLQI